MSRYATQCLRPLQVKRKTVKRFLYQTRKNSNWRAIISTCGSMLLQLRAARSTRLHRQKAPRSGCASPPTAERGNCRCLPVHGRWACSSVKGQEPAQWMQAGGFQALLHFYQLAAPAACGPLLTQLPAVITHQPPSCIDVPSQAASSANRDSTNDVQRTSDTRMTGGNGDTDLDMTDAARSMRDGVGEKEREEEQ